MHDSRAVVWDLDGVIVDSAAAHNHSWAVLATEYGLPYDREVDFPRIFGRHNTDIIEFLWGVPGGAESEKMAQRKEEVFREDARRLPALPGALELMKAASEAGWKQAIGSSAPGANVELLLEATGAGSYIQAISCGEDVTIGKPDPMVFRIAFERLGIPPSEGVVIEDAPSGVVAGLAAGSAVLAVTTTQPEEVLRAAGATRIVPSLAAVNVSDLDDLVQANLATRTVG